MKAVILEQTGGVEHLTLKEIDKPAIGQNEVLIASKALSVNPVDYKVRQMEPVLKMIYGEKTPVILGWDVAGVVVAVGTGVTRFKVGDRVFGMVNFLGAGDAYAEYVAAPEDHLAIIPEGVTFEHAAATTLAALTALQVLQKSITKGDRILIHAGSGGVGHFAIQIAKHLGAHVITTSSAKNKDFILSLGADEHIDYRAVAFQDVLSDLDFVFDMFNGDILYHSLKVLQTGGKIISLPSPEFTDETLALAAEKNIDLSFHMVQSSGEDMAFLADLLQKGIITPHIYKEFQFSEMAAAHEQLESGRTVGKVIVTL